jgi:hypothetical protein
VQGRIDEPVRLALHRQPGARAPVRPIGGGEGQPASSGGGAGNGLPR